MRDKPHFNITIKMQKHIIIVSVLVAVSSAFLLDSFKSKKWNDLKVTWGPNPLSSDYFVKMPRTTSEAVSKGFRKISDCDLHAGWRGARYVKNDDYAVVLLFDINGYIAGIQTTVPKSYGTYPKAGQRPPFVDDGDRWAISAYFTDPSNICTVGRSASQFSSEGTGTDLFIQNSSIPERSTKIPKMENGMSGTKWTLGKCFYTMGVHYWYNLSDDMSCDDYFPVFLLYNNGELDAFGWALTADLPSKHYEHPTPATFGLFMKSVPKCLPNAGTISTMHIYMTDTAALDLC